MDLKDDRSDSNPAIGCLFYVIGFFLVMYALFGLFAGYLIIPEIRSGHRGAGKELIVEGMPARIGGASFIMMYVGFFLTMRRNYLTSGWMKPTAMVLLGIGIIGILTSGILNQIGG